jgi:small conductance mechanosensitive channel
METNKVSQSAVDQMGQFKTEGIRFLYDKGPNLAGAIVILVAGVLVARFAGKLLQRWLNKKHLEPPVRMLVLRLVWLLVFLLFCLMAVATLGINIAPVIAMMGVAGVGLGLAMQGVLGNLVSGLLIIFTKPFRVGEYIEIAGNYGQVTDIELFSTTLLHPDQSRVVIPNRKISGEILHNYGTIRQHNITVGVAYDTDLRKALALIQEILARNPSILKDPAPAVGIKEFGESSINIAVMPWSNLADFGTVAGEIKLAIADAFRANRVEIPFPQREVRVVSAAPLAATG